MIPFGFIKTSNVIPSVINLFPDGNAVSATAEADALDGIGNVGVDHSLEVAGVGKVDTNVHDGSYCYKFTSLVDGYPEWTFPIALESGESYTFSFWSKGTSLTAKLNGDWTNIDSPPDETIGSADWTFHTYTFSALATANMDVKFYTGFDNLTGQTFFIDTLLIIKN